MNVIEWLDEIKDAKKREKDYRKDGCEIREIYANEKNTPFNVLYSNTETLMPALFSEVPRPVVIRRFKDEDPMGKAVSEAAQRILEYMIDRDIDDYDKYEEAMKSATLDGLLPGRGITSVKYESEDDWETACTDIRSWDKVLFGYAKKWTKMPWIAYEEFLDRKEATRLFGKLASKLKYTEGEEDDNEDYNKEENKDKGYRKTTQIYQIWDKSDRKIKYISPQYKDDFLKVDDDPLGLTGFFNCPEPLQFVEKTNDLVPTALYKLYENQAGELNRIQGRLNRVIEAIKVRGVYNGALGEDLEQILKEPDNALVPTDKSALLNEGGFDQNIWLLPLGELVGVAQQLMVARESCKQVIYEITGISDIVRGQSKASETLGAQKIKEAWGTMRVKRLQKEVQRYALELMRLMLDIAVNKFSEKSWAKMTMLPYSTTEQREQAQRIVEIARVSGQMGPTVEQAQMVLSKPYWGDILKILKDNYSRSYRIDIETNSTIDVEATEDKQLVGDFMNALGQFMNAAGPMMESGTMPFPAFKSMMLSIVKRYRFGREVEEELKAMQQPQPKANPQQEQAMKKFQQEQEKFVKDKQQFQQKAMDEQNKLKMEALQLEYDKKLAQMDLKYKEAMSRAANEIQNEKAQGQLNSIVVKHKSDVQSILDKHANNVKMELSKQSDLSERMKERDENDTSPKVVTIKDIQRENGEIVGAVVEKR